MVLDLEVFSSMYYTSELLNRRHMMMIDVFVVTMLCVCNV